MRSRPSASINANRIALSFGKRLQICLGTWGEAAIKNEKLNSQKGIKCVVGK